MRTLCLEDYSWHSLFFKDCYSGINDYSIQTDGELNNTIWPTEFSLMFLQLPSSPPCPTRVPPIRRGLPLVYLARVAEMCFSLVFLVWPLVYSRTAPCAMTYRERFQQLTCGGASTAIAGAEPEVKFAGSQRDNRR